MRTRWSPVLVVLGFLFVALPAASASTSTSCTWTVFPSPNAGRGANDLRAASAATGSDVWAVGDFTMTRSGPYQTLAEHWDGSAWSIVATPSPGLDSNFLFGVAALSAGDAWAVGETADDRTFHTLIEHWDGSTWSIAPSPNGGSRSTGTARPGGWCPPRTSDPGPTSSSAWSSRPAGPRGPSEPPFR